MTHRPTWTAGNRFTLLENGEAFFPRVCEAIRAARREVLLETFILFDDPVGRELRAALLDAARRGVAVHVLVDGWGSPDLDDRFLGPLLEAGVHWRVFEPAVRVSGWRLNPLRRMHRKLVVVDGETAFVGGINYSYDHLAESGPQAKQDYAVELQGPVVAQVHAFCRRSAGLPVPEGAEGAEGKEDAPRRSWWRRLRDRRSGDATDPAHAEGLAAFVFRDNRRHRTDIERQYRLALRSARSHVLIANAYFFPGYRLLRDMRRAARRGVRVELVLQGCPDMPIVRSAAQLLYAQLVRAGVTVHEYCERPLHGKVAVVDGRWATVGSSNLDPTSLALNHEANVLIRDAAFARTLASSLRRLIERHCRAVEAAPPGRTGLRWAQLRSAAVFHLVRWWPRWMHALPSQQPEVRQLGAVR